MSLPRAYLSQKLTQPLPIKDGAVLRTIGDAANYVEEAKRQFQNAWTSWLEWADLQGAAGLIEAQ